jgi:hypothetical protein
MSEPATNTRIARLETTIDHLTNAIEKLTKQVDQLNAAMNIWKGVGTATMVVLAGVGVMLSDTFKRIINTGIWGVK